MAIINSKNGEELLVLGVVPIPINSELTNSYKVSVSKQSRFTKTRVDSNTDIKPKYSTQTFTDYTINLEVISDGGVGSELIRLIEAFTSKYSSYIDDKKEVEGICYFDAKGNTIKKYELSALGKTAKIIKQAYEIGTRVSYLGSKYLFFDLALYNISSNVDENDPNIMYYTISCTDEYLATAQLNQTPLNVDVVVNK